MNTNQMKQVIPAIEQIHSWGNVRNYPVAIKEECCGRVISFTVTKPEITSAGWSLTLTRVRSSDTMWMMSSGSGECYLISHAGQ